MIKRTRPQIGIFGRRNVGKSSFINAILGEELAIVSSVAGTTTDPVNKNVEIHGIGPVVLVDTAGIDDDGDLGKKRVQKTFDVFPQISLGIILFLENEFGEHEETIVKTLKKQKTPFLLIQHKADTFKKRIESSLFETYGAPTLSFSSKTKENTSKIIGAIKKRLPASSYKKKSILGDLISEGDLILLVTPIDIEAPEGRMILPQVQTIRDVLDNDATVLIMKEREIDSFFKRHSIKPDLVVTDSQVFKKAEASIPKDVPLTSFSILFARMKGSFSKMVEGVRTIEQLKDGDRVLILESCSHHVAGDDIGRVKIPRWIQNYTGKRIHFDVTVGFEAIQRPLWDYSLLIQCGGCMLNEDQMKNRLEPAFSEGLAVTNYGMVISYCHGIFERAIKPFHLSVEEDF